ncbi:MAG: alpha/beta fold hydrolase [Propionibacteriaceae bacterium]|nr:alpha/beta fold hydrolase [Propionibacteriaceae bacterium]
MTIPEDLRPFDVEGGRVGVLFCHGFTGSPRSMRPWAQAVADAGYTVSVPRLPGHGTVWQELNVTSWRDWYDHADAAYRALQERCEQVFVAGLSMGGSLALRLAEQHTDVAGLLLVNPALGAVDPLARFAGVFKYLVPSTPAIANDIAKPDQDEGAYAHTPVAGVHELHKLWADVKSCLDLVTCPVLLCRSDIDHVVPTSSSDTIKRLISSDDITEVRLADSYHVATLDHDAPMIVSSSIDFLARVGDH